MSPDPLAVHVPGRADWNLYAYVKGMALRAVDPLGLQADWELEQIDKQWVQMGGDPAVVAEAKPEPAPRAEAAPPTTGKTLLPGGTVSEAGETFESDAEQLRAENEEAQVTEAVVAAGALVGAGLAAPYVAGACVAGKAAAAEAGAVAVATTQGRVAIGAIAGGVASYYESLLAQGELNWTVGSRALGGMASGAVSGAAPGALTLAEATVWNTVAAVVGQDVEMGTLKAAAEPRYTESAPGNSADLAAKGFLAGGISTLAAAQVAQRAGPAASTITILVGSATLGTLSGDVGGGLYDSAKGSLERLLSTPSPEAQPNAER